MTEVLTNNPPLLLFLVAAIGYVIGRITVAGTSLGVSAVLFVGLAFGALHPDMRLPEIVYELGLILFVYTIGLSSGRAFFASLRREGLRDNLFVVVVLVFATGLTLLLGRVLGLDATVTAGLFTGSLTNTPALASLLETVGATAPPDVREQALAEPVVGYSIAYPVGVIGVIAAIVVLRRLWRVDWEREAARTGFVRQPLENLTVLVTRPEAAGVPLWELRSGHDWDLTFGRVRRGGRLTLANEQTHLRVGDLVSVIGPRDDVAEATKLLGEATEEHLEADRREFDFRRVFVSEHRVAGRRLRDLDLPGRYGAFVTRVRRGDRDFVAHGGTVLELGDRVRVVARTDRMGEVSRFFGDSYRALSELNILTFNLGLALGLLVGMIPIPLPGGLTVELGFAGGPLVVALVLGALERTGPLVWNMPYSVNLTLRQVGIIMFLAGIGTRSGFAFFSTLQQGGALVIFLAGALITMSVALLTLWIGYKLLKVPMGVLIGMVAGLQTQPAVLGFALDQTKDDLPNVGYAAVYPVALISKIVFAQLLLNLA